MNGWLKGGVAELSSVAQQAAIPPKVIDQATRWFVEGISAAAGRLTEIATRFDGAMKHICEILHQEDSEQTRRMAMTIVANALIFHETLAGGPGELAEIRPLDAVRNGTGKDVYKRQEKKVRATCAAIVQKQEKMLVAIVEGRLKERQGLFDKAKARVKAAGADK